jgi:hypothetical protein
MSMTSFPAPTPVTEADLSPEFSDDALALEFAARHADRYRYVPKWGRWLYWDGTRWKFEDTLKHSIWRALLPANSRSAALIGTMP